MNRTNAGFPAMAAALLGLALAAPNASAAPRVRDEVFRAPALHSALPAKVAVLPVIGIVDDPGAQREVEEQWVELFRTTRTKWVPADEVREQLRSGSRNPEAAMQELERQVWRDAEVSPETARELARRLGSDAVLSVRIDRWQIADGGRAVVEMTATLSGANGERLWRISGLAGYGQGRTSSEPVCLPGVPMGIFALERDPTREAGRQDRMDKALHLLLARWAWSLPESPYDEASSPNVEPLLAGQSSDAGR